MAVLDSALDGLDDCLLLSQKHMLAVVCLSRIEVKSLGSYAVFVDLFVVRKVPGRNEELEVLALDSAGEQAVGDELDHIVLA